MGFEHRLRTLATLGLVVALGASSACSHPEREEKRKLLAPAQDFAQKQREAWQKIRTTDDSGALVPSDTKVAGVTLPRGLTAKWKRPHEWFYDGPFSVEQLDTYFRSQLEITTVHHPNNVTHEFIAVCPKATPGEHPVTLSIFPVPGDARSSRIDLREPEPPMQRVLTPEQVQAQVEARHRVAE